MSFAKQARSSYFPPKNSTSFDIILSRSLPRDPLPLENSTLPDNHVCQPARLPFPFFFVKEIYGLNGYIANDE
jgi:hypothetical protein